MTIRNGNGNGSSILDENTLGVVVKRGRRSRGTEGPGRSLRQARAMGATLGSGYLGIGTGILAGLQTIYGLSVFASMWPFYPQPLPTLAAWLLLLATLAAIAVSVATRGETMPNWMFALILVVVAIVVVVDFAAVWQMENIPAFLTASMCASSALLVSVTLRPTREVAIALATLACGYIAGLALHSPPEVDALPTQLSVLLLALLPPLIALYVVHGYRALVRTELDRVLVQSTVSAPRFALGMLASEELARLDLAAEELLDSVANGRIKLPLSPKAASTAASLATELRLHLMEGRRETWLYHAVTESETLGKSVTLSDPGSLAGLLDAGQRDGLFAAVWLLVTDRRKSPASVQLSFEAAVPHPTGVGMIGIPIKLTTTGVARNRVDPAIWDALAKVGRVTDLSRSGSLRVEILGVVANPAER